MHNSNVHPFQHERTAARNNKKQYSATVHNIQLSFAYTSESLALTMSKDI